MVYNLSIREVENPDKNCIDCLTTAFKYMVVDDNGGYWFGSDIKQEAEEYIIKHSN
jgi:hypothetical protein